MDMAVLAWCNVIQLSLNQKDEVNMTQPTQPFNTSAVHINNKIKYTKENP